MDSMISSPAARQFLQGAKDGLPFHIVIWPFAAIFGAIATQAGLNVVEVMGFSILVIAGSAQLAALQLMTENAPTVIVLATALAVNLRMGMYSASITPHLGKASLLTRAFAAYMLYDQPYALSTIKFEKEPDMNLSEKLGYFFGTAIPIGVAWYALTLIGALLGERIPSDIGVDFAVPITFLAVVAPMPSGGRMCRACCRCPDRSLDGKEKGCGMIEASTTEIWIVILGMAAGTFLIRFSFLGLVGDRPLPAWLLRLLRYTPVAVLPAVVAPMLLGAKAETDPLRLFCAAVTIIVGVWTKNVLWAILTGLGLFFGLGAFLG